MLVFEPMLAGAPNYYDVVPALAESWVVSDDNLTYTFTLRKDVTWHDGQPFTSADIVWSYTTLLHPAISGVLPPALTPIQGAQAYKNGEATEIPGLSAPDEYTVTITTESTSPTFLQGLATVWILPKHLLETAPPETLFDDPYFQNSLVGTGPFKFKEMQEDQFQTVDRYDGYYRGTPLLDSIICMNITQPSVAILSQESGELDIISVRAADDIVHVRDNPNLNAWPGPVVAAQNFDTGIVPDVLQDKRVRQAILYALDRTTITESLLKGTAKVMDTLFLTEWVPKDQSTIYNYDPDKAKTLLAESGWSASDTLEIAAYYTDAGTTTLLAAMQQYLADVGMKTTVRQTEWANIEKDWQVQNFGILYQGASGGPDPDFVRLYFHSESTYNLFRRDPKVDELIDEGASVLDPEARAPIYAELSGILNDLLWWIPLWSPLRYWAAVKNVQGVQDRLGFPGFYQHQDYQAHTWTKAT
jgi:peptide/nickel transport system substrate-binding protein